MHSNPNAHAQVMPLCARCACVRGGRGGQQVMTLCAVNDREGLTVQCGCKDRCLSLAHAHASPGGKPPAAGGRAFAMPLPSAGAEGED